MKGGNHENNGKNPELLTKMMKVGQLQKIELFDLFQQIYLSNKKTRNSHNFNQILPIHKK